MTLSCFSMLIISNKMNYLNNSFNSFDYEIKIRYNKPFSMFSKTDNSTDKSISWATLNQPIISK